MIKNWLSRYSLAYPRSLVYMLQASEYNIGDYLHWYHKSKDFNHIEKRKKFVGTTKSLLLLGISWLIILIILGIAISIVYFGLLSSKYLIAFLLIILGPYILAYLIVIPLFFIKILVQRPFEYFIVREAKKKIAAHRGIKIGIAGSFGKTTMREILKAVLSEGKKVAAPPHSYNTLLGISRFIKTLKGDEDIVIFELGEYYRGDIKKLCDLVGPSMGIITGVNEAHLIKFKSLNKTVETIYELADYVGRGTMYINGENDLAKKNSRPGHILYSRDSVGNYKIENQETNLDGTHFTLIIQGRKEEFSSSLLGLHQIGPLAATISLALDLGLSLEQIKTGISKTKPFDHRLEPKTDNAGVTILDDSYNGNPDGVKAVIDFLTSLKDHRRFYVTPGLVEMGKRTKDVHLEIGRHLAKVKIEKVVLVRNSVTPFIEEGLKEAGHTGDLIWFEDGLSALAALPVLTTRGDVVLIQNDWPDQYQ